MATSRVTFSLYLQEATDSRDTDPDAALRQATMLSD